MNDVLSALLSLHNPLFCSKKPYPYPHSLLIYAKSSHFAYFLISIILLLLNPLVYYLSFLPGLSLNHLHFCASNLISLMFAHELRAHIKFPPLFSSWSFCEIPWTGPLWIIFIRYAAYPKILFRRRFVWIAVISSQRLLLLKSSESFCVILLYYRLICSRDCSSEYTPHFCKPINVALKYLIKFMEII